MLKHPITYENFDGEEQTDFFYFNLNKAELLEMEFENKVGMAQMLQNIVDSRDNGELIRIFKDLILRAYGVRSEDGKRFIKNDQVREEFTQTSAFPELFMSLASNPDEAATFLTALLPKDIREGINLEEIKAKTNKELLKVKNTKDIAEVAPRPPAPTRNS